MTTPSTPIRKYSFFPLPIPDCSFYVLPMTASTITAPSPARQFQRAINTMLELARELLARLTPQAAAPEPLPPKAARAESALQWIIALARTLAGDRTYLRPYRLPRLKPFPALCAGLRARCGVPPSPKPTEATRAAARLTYMCRVFATEPTGKIAARLARRVGIKRTSENWPADLVAIQETPVEWARRAHHPSPAPIIPTPTAAPELQSHDAAAPPFHPRE